jgi:hypothetical protein
VSEEQSASLDADATAGNPDWNRTPSDEEAQQTAREADPDDLGTSDPTDDSIMAGGDATDLGSGDEGAGGTPYTEGYVTGGVHHPTIADLPPDPA